ncbi:hypothetical protein [Mesorhizobium sp. M4A.F.Ca.ET.050.02.1.1]|uniref:hypothetical protein n=1 Tax=Mesorhizobium sp. M4A.F.Ca.ET.050.02.1.1 TaxID=2496754 RepID=UPI00167CF9C7|nr:hypothetical protein [Mesorhizobium sp. M4A.F.Ca.ET.050.02.1.1]
MIIDLLKLVISAARLSETNSKLSFTNPPHRAELSARSSYDFQFRLGRLTDALRRLSLVEAYDQSGDSNGIAVTVVYRRFRLLCQAELSRS